MVYKGYRFGGRCVVTRDSKKINSRLDLFNHSPTGMEWGYGGSGPAQTALAILADFLHDDQLAVMLHQKFKWSMIASLPHKRWSLTDKQIRGWFTMHAAEIAEITGRKRQFA